MGEGRGRRENRERTGGHGGRGNGYGRKKNPKRNRFGIWGRPLGVPPRVVHF